MKKLAVIITIILFSIGCRKDCTEITLINRAKDFCIPIYALCPYHINGYNLIDAGKIDTTNISVTLDNGSIIPHKIVKTDSLGTGIRIFLDKSSEFCNRLSSFDKIKDPPLNEQYQIKFQISYSNNSTDNFVFIISYRQKYVHKCLINEYWEILLEDEYGHRLSNIFNAPVKYVKIN